MNNKISYSTMENFVIPLADEDLILREYTLSIRGAEEVFKATSDAALSYAVMRSNKTEFTLKRNGARINKSSEYPITKTKQYAPSPSF